MRKVAAFLVMIFTIIFTIPSISIEELSIIEPDFSKEQAHEIKTEAANSLSANEAMPPNNENTGNSTNQGLALEGQDKIYYSDGLDLWSMNQDGSQKSKIADQAYPMNIQILDDLVYYINEETNGIYRVNKNGTENQRIGQDKAYSLNIYNRRLYFMDRLNKLYITSMSLDGKDKKVIKDIVVNDMMLYNDHIFYMTKTGDLGKIRIDGANNMLIKKDIMQFDICKTGVYYIYDPRKDDGPKGLYHLDFENSQESQLLSDTPYSFNVHKDKIYYNHPGKLNLYGMNLDGTQKTKITGASTTQINIAGNYLFYKSLEDNKKIYRINLDGRDRLALQGKTVVTNVTDLTREINDLEGKEISPKLKRTYNHAKEIVSEIIGPHMSDYEKAKLVHDYVVNNASYDVEAAQSFLRGEDSDANAFMAYGVLINRKGVCQGYAEAVQILLSLAGLESELVIGDALDDKGAYIPHMWNIVQVDDEYYMLDATWDDPVGPKDVLSHDFFLVDSQSLKKTHVWAYDEYPPCGENRWKE